MSSQTIPQNTSSNKHFNTPRPRRSILKIILVILATTILLSLITLTISYFLWHRHLDNKLTAEFVRLRANGELITLQDIQAQYTKPINGLNAADYYTPRFDALTVASEIFDTTSPLNPAATQMMMPSLPSADTPQIPFFTETPSEYTRLNLTPPLIVLNDTKTYLASIQEDLSELLNPPIFTGCFYRDTQFQFPLLGPADHLQQIRNTSRHLQLAHWLAVHEKQPNDALQTLTTIRSLANTLENEPFLIGQLVRTSLLSLLNKEAQRAINAHLFNDQQLVQLQTILTPINADSTLIKTLQGERSALFAGINFYANNPIMHHLGLNKKEKLFAIQYYDAIKKDIIASKNTLPNASKLIQQAPFVYIATNTLLPAHKATIKTFHQIEYELTTTQLAIASYRFYLSNRQPPQNLANLTSNHLSINLLNAAGEIDEQITNDYKLRTTSNGLLVYHPGPDNTDNLGNPYNPQGNEQHGLNQTDITAAISYSNANQPILLQLFLKTTQAHLDNLKAEHENDQPDGQE
ncbi:hypothetical protein KS4_01740 [Poriferisphaera corsica]|uniref:Uncharacterized protein n=1 Tax=Poriferisphaera corsica TaxID=2528020 RepID=A0A517YPJ3_9BACT|nr:hypothetical protein [Poriferisphaera corsica]QDU32145.1 hypothetical protein KS4_01740 [Poriferisphaera corsica]